MIYHPHLNFNWLCLTGFAEDGHATENLGLKSLDWISEAENGMLRFTTTDQEWISQQQLLTWNWNISTYHSTLIWPTAGFTYSFFPMSTRWRSRRITELTQVHMVWLPWLYWQLLLMTNMLSMQLCFWLTLCSLFGRTCLHFSMLSERMLDSYSTGLM